MENLIHVSYESTSSAYKANQILRELEKQPLIACDFEVATRYTPAERLLMEEELLTSPPKRRRIELESTLAATALDHPSHTVLTHLSVATSESEGYVFILDNPKITNRILSFLTTTTVKQIWHGASFDFRQIHYRTGKFPIDYEDTQILAKTILNHVDNSQSLTGLKHLAGHRYGAWGLSADNFDLSHMYDPQMLLYSAIDAAATYWLWNSINNHLKDTAC